MNEEDMRSVIKRSQVQVDEASAPRERAPRAGSPSGTKAPPSPSPPRVRLIQIDAETQALEFTCACGEVSLIEIQCEKKS